MTASDITRTSIVRLRRSRLHWRVEGIGETLGKSLVFTFRAGGSYAKRIAQKDQPLSEIEWLTFATLAGGRTWKHPEAK